ALLQSALDCAAQMPGLYQITLSVTAGNAAAERLYAAFGFVRCGLLPRALEIDGVYHDEILMTRPMPAV
ncbi:MAG: GNAT family N-acetyltransferase, partial [Pseudomonadota bacterium]|nr:GNAT family N-acetyltransferase [Pseudomonadota bacterium]